MNQHETIDLMIQRLEEADFVWLGQALHTAIAIERQHRSKPDGFPLATHGSSPPTGRSSDGSVDLTSVEAAVVARGAHRDEYREHLLNAVTYLGDAVRAVGACRNRLDAMQAMRRSGGIDAIEPGCWAMGRIGKWEAIFRRTDGNGILEDTRPLGRWAHRFLHDNKRLPTIEECRQHAAGKYVYVKAG